MTVDAKDNNKEKRKTLSGFKKAELVAYLRYHAVEFGEDALRDTLYEQAREYYESHGESELKKLLEAVENVNNRHTLLFLPPYMPDLNPIEQVWGFAKNYLARRRPVGDEAFTKQTTESLFQRGLDLASGFVWRRDDEPLVTTKYKHMWEAACVHTDKTQDEFRAKMAAEEPAC